MNEAENKTVVPTATDGKPAPENKPVEEGTSTASVEQKPEVKPDEGAQNKAVKEAFIRGRIERRENKALKAELESLKERLNTAKGNTADAGEDGDGESESNLRKEINALKAEMKELVKSARNGEAAQRKIEQEKKADMLLLNDHDIRGVEDMAAIEAMVDPVLYARRPDLAVQTAIAEWKESQGISKAAQSVAENAKNAGPSSRANAGNAPDGDVKGSIMAQINSLDPSKPGAKEELEKLLKKLQN